MNLTDSGYVTTYSITAMSIPTPGFTDLLTNLLDTAGNILTQKIYGSILHENVLPVISRHNQIMTIGNGQTPFTEGNNFGQMTFGQKTFICYLDYWPVSVEDIPNDSHISIYPNPAIDEITISVPGSKNVEYELTILDMLGRELHHKASDGNTTLSVSNFPKGIYTVRINNKGETHTTKLVIQ